MKKLLLFAIVLCFGMAVFSSSAEAYSYSTRGYFRSSGTYVAPHYKTSPDTSRWNNYSTKGNYNPYTGKKGYTSPYRSYRSYNKW